MERAVNCWRSVSLGMSHRDAELMLLPEDDCRL